MTPPKDKYKRIDTCPICDSKSFHKKMEVGDYSISKEIFTLEVCSSCSFLITNPRPKNELLPDYYKSEEYISHSGTRKGIINKLYHYVQKHNIKRKYKSFYKSVPRGTWMDYGAGNGAFLKYLKEQKLSSVGYEPDEAARNIGTHNGMTILDSVEYKPGEGEYAAITMWHVLEHVPELNEIIQIHKSNLMDNGILVIAVPNHLSYDACYYKNFWAAYDVPRHLWHFSENDIMALTSKHGFEHVKTSPMVFDSYYVSMLSEKYRRGNMIRGVIIGAISNIYARVSGYPFSSQIYVFRKKTI